MPSVLAYIAPLALLFPLMGEGTANEKPSTEGSMAAQSVGVSQAHGAAASCPANVPAGSDFEQDPQSPYRPADKSFNALEAFYSSQTAQQVRIEQRVIVRISPRRTTNRNSLLARLPQRALSTRFEERELQRCLPVSRIAGVQTGTGNRLLLFLSDQQIVSVNLERACRARDFYSGFYVERNADGNLCAGRDQLQSRSGAKCEVERMHELVEIDD